MCKVNTPVYFVHKSSAASRHTAAGESHWIPNTDVYVAGNDLVIKVELAGLSHENLELIVEGNRLMISGHRPDGSRTCKCKFLVMEINYGHFECVIEIPPGYDLPEAKATYQNGFLQVNVPKATDSSQTFLVPVSEEQH